MIPALSLNYEAVDARVREVKQRMDEAESAELVLRVGETPYTLFLDLRFRGGHASGGLMREPGVVANLPSGEAYIVPYEGERKEPSLTAGDLPENRVAEVRTIGPEAEKQRWKVREEAAYGNIAELGVGVLGEWGIAAVGSILLDEKLGLHIAFGRSDHFGGATGPQAFKSAARVVHVDWVYVPSIQPRISVDSLTFRYKENRAERIMNANKLVV
jgi:leucyl aminopeptidase (aminopeptidase T)